jgi:hypothetical protein
LLFVRFPQIHHARRGKSGHQRVAFEKAGLSVTLTFKPHCALLYKVVVDDSHPIWELKTIQK